MHNDRENWDCVTELWGTGERDSWEQLSQDSAASAAMGGCGKDYTRSSGELLSPLEHVAAPGADGHPSGSSLMGIGAAPVGMDQCAPQGLCSHGHSAELLEVRVNGQGGRGMPILPLSHAGSCHICL